MTKALDSFETACAVFHIAATAWIAARRGLRLVDSQEDVTSQDTLAEAAAKLKSASLALRSAERGLYTSHLITGGLLRQPKPCEVCAKRGRIQVKCRIHQGKRF